MNKSGLVNAVKDQLGVSTGRAKAIVDAVLEEVENAVAAGQKVSLRGLGVFERVSEGSVPVPVFRPAKALTDAAAGAAGGIAGAAGGIAGAAGGIAEAAGNVARRLRGQDDEAPTPVRDDDPPTSADAGTSAATAFRPARGKPPGAPATRPAAGRAAPAKKSAARKTAAKKAAGRPGPSSGTTPEVVPLEPLHDPAADALAAVNAELARPVPGEVAAGPASNDVELAGPEEPDTVVYRSETPDEQR